MGVTPRHHDNSLHLAFHQYSHGCQQKKNFLVAEFRDVEELLVDKVDDGVNADNGVDKTVIRA